MALFVQGCRFHCENCFNADTWDFSGGREWTAETKGKLLEYAARPYIRRISILGGEPLEEESLEGVLDLVNEMHISFPQKTIWLYTGYRVEEIRNGRFLLSPSAASMSNACTDFDAIWESQKDKTRDAIIRRCDVLIDGQYIDSQRDITLPWRGSRNQRVIDVQESIRQDSIVLY